MIVEFIGESGCGKSTLAREVLSNLKTGKTKGSLSAAQSVAALFRVLFHRSTRKIFCAALSLERSVNGSARIAKNALYLAGVTNIILSDKKYGGIWIVDQGVLQFVLSVFYATDIRKIKNGTAEKAVDLVLSSCAYKAIVCRCDYETLCKRIEARRSSGNAVSRRIERADRELIAQHAANLDHLSAMIPSDRRLAVDTGEACERNADRIVDFIGVGR